MGGVLKSIGGVVGKIAPVASIASSFLPGGSLIGKVLSGVGKVGAATNALGAGAAAAKQAQNYNNQVGGIAQGQAGAFHQYYGPLMQAYAKSMGYDPTTKTFDPHFNPYGGTVGSAMRNQYAETTDHAYDQAANQLGADSLARGFSGYDSGRDSMMGNIRRNEGQDLAGFNRNLLVQGQQDQSQRMASLLPFLSNQGNTAQEQLKGLGAVYQSKADNIGGQLGGLAGVLGQSGVFDFLKKKRPQSTSAGTTTANAAPVPTGITVN